MFLSNKNQIETTIEFNKKEARSYLAELHEEGKIISHLELYNDFDDVLKYEQNKI